MPQMMVLPFIQRSSSGSVRLMWVSHFHAYLRETHIAPAFWSNPDFGGHTDGLCLRDPLYGGNFWCLEASSLIVQNYRRTCEDDQIFLWDMLKFLNHNNE